MSFSVSCSGCGLEYSGRRPFAQPANAARPPFLSLLWEIGRWLRTARARGRDAVARGVPRRARLLTALPQPLPRALDVGALVDGARPGARVSRRVRDPILRQPRDARLRPLPLAHGDRRQPQLRGRDRRPARRPAPARERCPLHPADRRRRRAASRRRGRALRPGRDRDARRPGARTARGPDAEERRVLGGFSYTTNEAVLHTDARFLPRARAARASWNYRLEEDGRPTITYHLNRLQALEAERDYCLTLNEHVPEEHVLERFTYEHPLYTVATLQAQARTAAACRRWDALRRRLLRQRLPRGRPRERRRGRARPGSGVVKSALYTGTLMHVRRGPTRHVFRYPVSYWLFDLDELPELQRRIRLFSVNRTNVVSLRDRDHFDGAPAEAGGHRPRRRPDDRARPRAHPAARARLRLQPRQLLLVLPRRRLARLHGLGAEQHLRRAAARGVARPGAPLRTPQAAPRVALLRARAATTSTRSRSPGTRCGLGSTSATTTARCR